MEGHATSQPVDLAARMLGLPGFRVLAAGEVGDELELLIETVETVTGCPRCGVIATAHGRRPHLVRDVAAGGRRVALVWSKRLWRCEEALCPQRTWSETSTAIAPRAALTERARVWACREVGQRGQTVAAVAALLTVGWGVVMRAVRAYGQPLVEDLERLAAVTGLGVDEHAWLRANARRHTQFVTGVVDLTPGRPARLLDVTQGRSGKVYADWIQAREETWRERITIAALDPFRGYATALSTELPHATRVLDAFHVVKLANAAVDDVRRRVQQETLGHRGHKDDPLYEVRRLLRKGAERLTPRQRARLDAALRAGDPDGAVTLAYACAQQVRAIYHAPTPMQGRALAEKLVATLPSCPIPEIARLGRTLRSWRTELLAYFDTAGTSNGPTEAINLVIEKIRRNAHGFRNFANYRLRLLLHCGVTWNTQSTPRIRSRRPRFVA